MEAWGQLLKVYHPATFPSWLRKIIFKQCDRIRRKRREQVVSNDALSELASRETQPDRHLETMELKHQLRQAVESLPDHEKECILLFYMGDHSMREVGSFLELPVKTVKSRLHAGRRRLREGMVSMVADDLPKHAPSRNSAFAARVASLIQPLSMRTSQYLHGLTTLNGNEAWMILRASLAGDEPTVVQLLQKDPNLIHADFWYESPLSLAVLGSHPHLVALLLAAGADPGRCRSLVVRWDDLLARASERDDLATCDLLLGAMKERFNYSALFDALSKAILTVSLSEIDLLLDANPELASAADATGNTPIHWAVLSRQMDLIPYLLERGTNIDARRIDGRSALEVAMDFFPGDGHGFWLHPHSIDLPENASPDRWAFVRALISRGADYSLAAAAGLGDTERAMKILKTHPESAARLDLTHRSPLSRAAREGHVYLVQLLLDHGADPTLAEMDAPRGAALFLASAHNHLDVARILLEAGADPNADYDSSGACLDIVGYTHPDDCHDMQDLLKQYGAKKADWNLESANFVEVIGKEPKKLHDPWFLHYMLAQEDEALVDTALRADVDFPRRLATGVSPNAVQSTTILNKLLTHGMAPNEPGWLGRTYLHVYAERNHVDAAKMILDAGADIDAIDMESGGTPLATAVRHGCSEMARYLLQRGADPDVAIGPWAMPRTRAEKSGREDLVRILKQAESSKGRTEEK